MMKNLILAAMVVAAVVGIVLLARPRPLERTTLRMYAGGGLQPAVDKLVAAFEAETAIKVEPDYGGSGMIISRARDDRTLDLFLPGDEWYVDQLQQFTNHVKERATIAWFVPTIIVAKGNPKHVTGLADFARADLRAGLGNAKSCQIGRVSTAILAKAGVDVSGRQPKLSLMVNELGVWVKTDAVDAAIVWDATAANIAGDVDTIPIPPQQNIISKVVLASMTTTQYSSAARKFLQFVQGPKGRKILQESGYRVESPACQPASAAD